MINLDSLNEQQREAVTYTGTPILVIAGAGTGKTKTLTYRIAYLIGSGVKAYNILALTFTNKAAREMRERVLDMLGLTQIETQLSTFHSFGAEILRHNIGKLGMLYNSKFLIIDDDDSLKVVKEVIKSLNFDPKDFNVKDIRNSIAKAKSINRYNFLSTATEAIYIGYCQYLESNNLVDFDDLLLLPIKLFEKNSDVLSYYQHKYTHILVDEFQDTDIVQYYFLRLLCEKTQDVFLVGDPDQSIYSFRGANVNNIFDFEQTFKPKIVVLDINYRSPNSILSLANSLIQHNTKKVANKTLHSSIELPYEPMIINYDSDTKEVYGVLNTIEKLRQKNGYSYKDFAVLYRSNFLSKGFEDACIQENIPHIIYGGMSFYERAEIKDILAYIFVVNNPNDSYHLKRIINTPRRKIGQTTIDKIDLYATTNNLSFYEAMKEVELPFQTDASIHKFIHLLENMRSEFNAMKDLSEIVPYIYETSGYASMLKEMEDKETAMDKHMNIMELGSTMLKSSVFLEGSFDDKLRTVLDNIALYTSLDKNSTDGDAIILSTIHQVKGLEFKVVFLVAMEENIFPPSRVFYEIDIEEERRIAYVGITRAREQLFISYSTTRWFYGKRDAMIVSGFVNEMKPIAERKVPKLLVAESASVIVNNTDYKPGDKVIHEVFGSGIVVSIIDTTVVVAFQIPHGIKKLKAGHKSFYKA